MKKMKLADIIRTKGELWTINQHKTIHEAIKQLVAHNIGALLVLDDAGKLVGIISERDILRESAERDHLLRKSKVESIMTKDLIIGLPDDEVEYALGVMTKNRIRHMPVLDNDELVSIVSIGDLVKAQLTEREYENRYLQQYMFGH
ncbi:MAG: CBS domain-containing protein [Calditrichaeota bacterium]|nr:MAG: CBS domain-containing protein [Calditrichota bacterium]